MKILARIAILAAVAVLGVGARQLNWDAVVVVTPEGGHRIGNPDAKVKLIEFVSYTCSHCAHFEIEAQGPMQLAWVTPGLVSIEVRHLIRDPVDLTAAVLTNCGAKEKFPLNHSAMLRSQDKWMSTLQMSSKATTLRWRTGTMGERFRAIAGDLDFYEVMATRGYDRMELDKCLNDAALSERLAGQSRKGADAYAVKGTPNFVVNGTLLPDVHDWTTLRPEIAARLK